MVVSEKLWILTTCLLRPMSRNSVLEEFSVKGLPVVQEKIRVSLSIDFVTMFQREVTSAVEPAKRIWFLSVLCKNFVRLTYIGR